MKTPAILDISNCLQMEMYVYNDSGADIVMGSRVPTIPVHRDSVPRSCYHRSIDLHIAP